MFSSFDSSYSNANRQELSDPQLEAAAPSIFASRAMSGVSDRYTYLPTSQLVATMRGNGWVPVFAKEQRVRLEGRRGFQKHVVRFQRKGTIIERGEYVAEVVLVNSHDACAAYQLHAGLYRLICANGLMVSDSTFQHVSIRHSGYQTQEVLDASFKVLDSIPAITENVELFRSRRLTPVESKAFAEAALILRYDDPAAAPISPERLLSPRRRDDQGDDLWHTYNRVQENLTQGGLKDYSRRKQDGHRFPRTRAISGLDENTRVNKALWHLAEALRAENLPDANRGN